MADPHSLARPPEERRGLTRHRCRLDAVCDWVVGPGFVSRPVVVHEISANGATLALSGAPEKGTVLTVRLATATEKVAFVKLGRLIHTEPEKLGEGHVGVFFLQPLRPEEVEWLLCPPAQQASTLYFDI
jgi:hypothetical protein